MAKTKKDTRSIKQFLTSPIFLDLLLIAAVLLFSLAVWLPTRYLPFHWDGAGFFSNAIADLINNNFSPLTTTQSDFAHPPLLFTLYAVVFSFFGRSMLLSHILMFPFLPIIMISTYYLAKKISNTTIGIISTFLVGLTPVILAEYGIVYIDLPAASLTITGIALWVYNRKLASMIIYSAAILIKFTSILVFPLFIFLILLNPRKAKTNLKSLFSWLIIPPIILIIWLGYHYSVTGWLLTRPDRSFQPPNTIPEISNSLKYVLNGIFISQGRWLLTFAAVMSIAYAFISQKLKHQKPNYYILSMLYSCGIFALFFTLTAEFAQRYAIVIYPIIYLTSLELIRWSLSKLNLKKSSYIVIAIGFFSAITLISYWHPKSGITKEYNFRPPTDLSYQDMIQIHREASTYLEIMHSKDKVYGGFPENIYTTQPHNGYVFTSLDFNVCRKFTYIEEVNQIIYFHPYSPSQIYCRQLMDQLNLEPIKRFESGDRWLELYQVLSIAASPSAQITPSP